MGKKEVEVEPADCSKCTKSKRCNMGGADCKAQKENDCASFGGTWCPQDDQDEVEDEEKPNKKAKVCDGCDECWRKGKCEENGYYPNLESCYEAFGTFCPKCMNGEECDKSCAPN